MHHGLHSASDRPKPSRPQQVQGSGSQRGHHSGAITAIAVGVLMKLGVADPVPAFNAPAVSHQLQQRLWCGAQAGEEQVLRLKGLAVAAAARRHLHDPAGADPGLPDVLRRLFGPQRPAYLIVAGQPPAADTRPETEPLAASVHQESTSDS